jgi:L-asparagine oxygenase
MSFSIIEIGRKETSIIRGITEDFPAEFAIGKEAEAIDWVANHARQELLDSDLTRSTIEALRLDRLVVISGLPFPMRLPDTPRRYKPSEEADLYDFDVSNIAIASLIGECYSTRHLRGARIVTDIFPKDEMDNKQDSAFGSRQPFDFHADGAVHPDTKPEYFSFQAIRNHEQAPTYVSYVEPADLSEESLLLLTQPVFNIFYEQNSKSAHRIMDVPVIIEGGELFQFNYYGASKVSVRKGLDDRYHQALREFDKALQANSQPVNLSAGELLVLDNKSTLHSRHAFSPHPDPRQRRWIRRIHIATNKVKIDRIATQGRMLKSDIDRGSYI